MSDRNEESLDLKILSNFIHQLINPLNGIIGTLDNIIEGEVPANKKEQRLRAVRAQLEHSVVLIRNLAYFSMNATNNGGYFDYEEKICIIPQIVIEAALFFQEEGLSRDIKIHLVDRATQHAVKGAPDLLRQVLMNLFDNAIKYSESGATVRVETRIQRSTGDLIIEVISRGAKLDPDEKEKIFELGYRGKSAKQTLASGTGLGLFICRRIIEDVHKGKIEAEYSDKSRETTFRIRIPNGYVSGE